MLDVAVAYEKYKFLGYEFLTWLWFVIETDQESIRKFQPETKSLDMGNRLVLENRKMGTVETITIKGDDAGLEEARLSLKKGAIVSEMNLMYRSGAEKWQFTIKGESFHISNMKTPETTPAGMAESGEDWEAGVLERIFLYEKGILLMKNLYQGFIRLRIQNEWSNRVVPQMKNWVSGSKA
jgi:hypothetical protein